MIPIRDSTNRPPIFPIGVYGIVLLNVIVFLREVELPTQAARNAFIDGYALIPYDLSHGVQLSVLDSGDSQSASATVNINVSGTPIVTTPASKGSNDRLIVVCSRPISSAAITIGSVPLCG